MKTTRQINAMVKEASQTGRNLYAQGLQVNTLGQLSENWLRVMSAKKLYGEVHVHVIGQSRLWAKVIESTKFDIR